MPAIDWANQPRLPTENWPEERRLRTSRSYAVEYLRTMLPTLEELLGPADAGAELGRVARLVGLQFHEETARDLGLPTDVERGDAESARAFAQWLSAVLRAQGETVETFDQRDHQIVRMDRWRIGGDLPLSDKKAAFTAWNQLWLGAAAAHDRFLEVKTTGRLDEYGWSISWQIGSAPR